MQDVEEAEEVARIEEEDRTSDEYIKANLRRIASLQEESGRQMKSNEEMSSLVSGKYTYVLLYMCVCMNLSLCMYDVCMHMYMVYDKNCFTVGGF
jgi:hypothetical protein